ncbi:group II intron reverse transcriptase/maturase [Nocardioides sp. AE5]|uniref:group II intron reverse transcriptase/maturase n=1 Tax=Nocardioides sp. AE5 TaxID=2962573 RepID=UPI002881AEBB|nr:group II intron reverse transcriptase/maturase [Nocardioides sp. AE5]MDT0201846.1 group II intron reverse transcriptase/maturase [Nocardioides sp. AE5]
MPKDATLNSDAPSGRALTRTEWVSEMQVKLHRWAVADPGRRFDDVFNLVHHRYTLITAWERVKGNKGARTAGSDGLTVARIETEIGVAPFLDDLRSQLKEGTYRPEPVRERKIPKPGGSGKVRRLGIPTVADRVVQAALKVVLEPIFEADFLSVSYGFRPNRRAHDAIAEIHRFGTHGYRWVLDADIEACFDSIDHTALMERVRGRVKNKRVLRLVKAFLKAGILTELGEEMNTPTGTPQGGILSPLLANIALSALDEHLHAGWQPGGEMSTHAQRQQRRRSRRDPRPNWRVIRYADDFVVLVDGERGHVEALQDEIADVLAPLGLRLSQTKTKVVHMEDGFDFLGFHIQWRRKRGTNKWYVYTFVADRAIRQAKAKIRAWTRRTSQRPLKDVLVQINLFWRGWATYFRHAVASHTFDRLHHFIWWRLVRMMRQRHRWNWHAVRRWLAGPNGGWRPIHADGIELVSPNSVPITRYRYRGYSIPNPWVAA